MMEQDYTTPEWDILEREERCRKALKTVAKAIFMRLLVLGILFWSAFVNGMELWVLGLLVFVLIINLTGIFPLVSEWRKQRQILKETIAEDEA